MLKLRWVRCANERATTLGKLNGDGIIINLAFLKEVAFSPSKTQVTIQGGALIVDTVAAGAANHALIATDICNCVGTLGAILGGGVGNLMGQHGLGVDNILSLNVVTAAGRAITVTFQSNPQLWFALRGAGPNFGIVTSATLKSYPVTTPSGLNAWLGALIFTSPQLEVLIQAIDKLVLQPKMALSLTFANSGTRTAPPTIIVSVFYYGTEAEGKAAFGPSTLSALSWTGQPSRRTRNGTRLRTLRASRGNGDPISPRGWRAWIRRPGARFMINSRK